MSVRATMESSPLSYEEWFGKPNIQVLAASDALDWSGVHVSAVVLNPGKEFYPSPQVEDYTLVTALEGSTQMRIRVGSHQIVDVRAGPGELEIVPPFVEADSLWDAPITAAFIRISSRLVERLAGAMFRGDPEYIKIPLNLKFSDPLLRELVVVLCNETYNTNPSGTLYVDSLMQTMILHLLTRYTNAIREPTTLVSRNKLTPLQMRLFDEYIQAHLDQKISLENLARCLHMSVPHFERLFRRSFGCAPYRYVLERRIERAKRLLGNSSMTLYEVARESGFANQSHLTKHFTRMMGVSPARYRAQRER